MTREEIVEEIEKLEKLLKERDAEKTSARENNDPRFNELWDIALDTRTELAKLRRRLNAIDATNSHTF